MFFRLFKCKNCAYWKNKVQVQAKQISNLNEAIKLERSRAKGLNSKLNKIARGES